MIKNSRGSALLEGIPVFALLSAAVIGILMAVYIIFGRAWIQFQSEQALYCLSENHPQHECRTKFEAKLNRFLPWGKSRVSVRGRDGDWNVRVEWKLAKHIMVVAKNLNLERAAKTKASPL